jgi:hypothetical protein
MDKNSKEGMGMTMLCGLINTFVMVFGVALLIALTNPTSLQQGLIIVAAIWVGFTATVKGADSVWAKKPWQLFWIDNGYSLVAVMISTMIIMNIA